MILFTDLVRCLVYILFLRGVRCFLYYCGTSVRCLVWVSGEIYVVVWYFHVALLGEMFLMPVECLGESL